jgi:ABC-2 type transport system ATP-binding protein
VAIVDHGRVIALGTPAELIASLGGEHVVEFTLDGRDGLPIEEVSGLNSVRSARLEGDCYSLNVGEPHIAIPELIRSVRDRGLSLAGLTTRHASLEDVFVTLTGRHLRDQ